MVAVSTVAVLWTGSVPAYSRPYLILMVTHRCEGDNGYAAADNFAGAVFLLPDECI